MMTNIGILSITAASIGFFHTLLGPDHYLPFIALSKAKKWSLTKTLLITFFCGIGHVLSSVLLGFIGIGLGIALFKLENIEAYRGDIAAWFLIIFGFLYFIWGLHRIIRNHPHRHSHIHDDGKQHIHPHQHQNEHSHIHSEKSSNSTAWILFVIFIFGPCEPLIPLIMYPAAQSNILAVIIVTLVFAIVTIGTMLTVIGGAYYGLKNIHFHQFGKYSHAFAGVLIFLCGGAIKFLGL